MRTTTVRARRCNKVKILNTRPSTESGADHLTDGAPKASEPNCCDTSSLPRREGGTPRCIVRPVAVSVCLTYSRQTKLRPAALLDVLNPMRRTAKAIFPATVRPSVYCLNGVIRSPAIRRSLAASQSTLHRRSAFSTMTAGLALRTRFFSVRRNQKCQTDRYLRCLLKQAKQPELARRLPSCLPTGPGRRCATGIVSPRGRQKGVTKGKLMLERGWHRSRASTPLRPARRDHAARTLPP